MSGQTTDRPEQTTPADTVIHARWIIPVEPAGCVLEHHALVIRNGLIEAVLPSAAVRRGVPARRVLERPDHALIPGLVNAHTHAAMTLMRGLADDLPLMRWLQEHIWPAEQAHVGREFVADGVEAACAEFIQGGVTTFNDMYFFPEVAARVAARAGLRMVAGMIVIDFPSNYAQHSDDYLRLGLALRDAWKDHPRISTVFAPHAPYTVGDATLRQIGMLAEELDTGIHMHVHETRFEVEQSVARTGKRPLAHLDEAGLLGPRLQAVHMTQLDDAEIRRLAEAGVQVIHCPESNLKLASGFCPVQRLLDAGVTVALGTDGAASNNDLDLFAELRTAALLAKGVSGDAAAVPAEQALRMATLDGARALGLSERIGSLVPGKAADVVAVDLSGLETRPLYHPVSQLVYATGRHRVSDTWVAGEHLLAEGCLTTLDSATIGARLDHWQARLAASA